MGGPCCQSVRQLFIQSDSYFCIVSYYSFAGDKVNFSISTDDPTIFGNSMESEFQLCTEEIGLTLQQLYQCVSARFLLQY